MAVTLLDVPHEVINSVVHSRRIRSTLRTVSSATAEEDIRRIALRKEDDSRDHIMTHAPT